MTNRLRWINSSKKNPCPICGRTKDGDCRISADGQQVICHRGSTHGPPDDLKPSPDPITGRDGKHWAFTHNNDRGAHFKLDQPLNERAPTPAPMAELFRVPAASPARITGLITLARCEPVELDASIRKWKYSPTQGTKRIDKPGGKDFRPHHLVDKDWTVGAGPDQWPLYREDDAIQSAGFWVLETEGEKCADIVRAGGRVAISQPGHAHTPEQIKPRYQRLLDAGVLGIVYLVDNDEQGRKRSQESSEAAAAVGLPLLVLPAADVWRELPEKGSIDDASGTAAERVEALEVAIAAALERHREQQVPANSDPSGQEVDDQLAALLGPIEEGKLRKPPKNLLTQVIETLVPLQYNELTSRIENDGHSVDGDFLGTLYLQLAERYSIDVQKERAADAALLASRRHSYHPVRLYLQDLEARAVRLSPEDWAALDARIFGSEESSGWGIVHLQRQLIAAVARAMRPGCEVHTALVLHSDQQGIGKSSLWKILGGSWFSDSLGDLKDLKDDRLQLHSAWIHEWGEIDAVMGKRDSETLKRFLSCSQDDVRRPYGRAVESLKRSCVIVGTTNRRDFIKDPTGNRRYPIISVKKIETGWVQDHRDAIWGSALAAFRAGDRWHYEGAEIKQLNDAALSFSVDDPLRDQIETWAEDHPQVSEAPLARILREAGCIADGERPDTALHRQAGSVMRAIGWTRTEKKSRYLLPNGMKTDNTYGWIRDAA